MILLLTWTETLDNIFTVLKYLIQIFYEIAIKSMPNPLGIIIWGGILGSILGFIKLRIRR